METHTLESVLAETPLFRSMKPEHLGLITGCAENVRYETGAFVGRRGEPAESFWIVRQGRIALEIHAPGRGALTIQTLTDGDVVGWSWLLPPYRWHYDVRALAPTRALRMDGKCLRGKFAKDPELGYEIVTRFATVMAERLNAMSMQLLDVYGSRHAFDR